VGVLAIDLHGALRLWNTHNRAFDWEAASPRPSAEKLDEVLTADLALKSRQSRRGTRLQQLKLPMTESGRPEYGVNVSIAPCWKIRMLPGLRAYDTDGRPLRNGSA